MRSECSSLPFAILRQPCAGLFVSARSLTLGTSQERGLAQAQQQIAVPPIIWIEQVKSRTIVSQSLFNGIGLHRLLSGSHGVDCTPLSIAAACEVEGKLGELVAALWVPSIVLSFEHPANSPMQTLTP